MYFPSLLFVHCLFLMAFAVCRFYPSTWSGSDMSLCFQARSATTCRFHWKDSIWDLTCTKVHWAQLTVISRRNGNCQCWAGSQTEDCGSLETVTNRNYSFLAILWRFSLQLCVPFIQVFRFYPSRLLWKKSRINSAVKPATFMWYLKYRCSSMQYV